jgi:hypothetical protein
VSSRSLQMIVPVMDVRCVRMLVSDVLVLVWVRMRPNVDTGRMGVPVMLVDVIMGVIVLKLNVGVRMRVFLGEQQKCADHDKRQGDGEQRIGHFPENDERQRGAHERGGSEVCAGARRA